MKFIAVLTLSLMSSLSFAQTKVIQTEDYIKAELTADDSNLLYHSMMVEPTLEFQRNIKGIQTHDGIVKLQCELSTLLTARDAKCSLELSKMPAREQSTSIIEDDVSYIAKVDTYHEAESIFSKFNFDEMRGANGIARFYFSDDMKVQVNCMHLTKNGSDEYSCQFGIQKN